MKRLPLRSFRLQNFKAVRDSGTVKFGPLTVFIGNNGSGKSSLIEGLETFRDIVVNGLDAAMNRWRGFEHVWNHAVPHELRRVEGQRPFHTNPMSFQVACCTKKSFGLKAKQVVNMGEGGNDVFIQQEHFTLRMDTLTLEETRDAFGKVTTTLKNHPENFKWDDGRSNLNPIDFNESWQFLALSPDAIGQPVPQQRSGRIRLAKNGANIAEYLNEIRTLDLGAFDGILESIRYVLPYPEDLQPTLASELERAFFLKLKEEKFEVPGWLLSTGTLRIVALLACLRHPNPPPLLVVEEVENGLDPRTLHLFVEEIRAAITAGTTQVILTTHSPYLLDLLDLSHIVVVERKDGQPVFQRANAKELTEWAKSFSPGQLYTMGNLTKENR